MNVAKINPLELPSLPLGERSHLPICPAIYFVMQDERVLYIGKTLNLAQRWATHHKWSYLVQLGAVVRVAWLECSDENILTQIETALIRQFAPELNGRNCNPYYAELSSYIDKDLKLRFKLACTAKQKTMSEVITDLIEEWLEENENPSPAKKEKEEA